MFQLERIDHVAITVSNIENSVKWYSEVLGLERYYEGVWDDVPIMMGKGGTCIALFKVKSDNPKPTPGRDTLAMVHLAFRADRKNFELAQISLKESNISFSFQDHDISHSIYFNDPDGHEIEITTYEL